MKYFIYLVSVSSLLFYSLQGCNENSENPFAIVSEKENPAPKQGIQMAFTPKSDTLMVEPAVLGLTRFNLDKAGVQTGPADSLYVKVRVLKQISGARLPKFGGVLFRGKGLPKYGIAIQGSGSIHLQKENILGFKIQKKDKSKLGLAENLTAEIGIESIYGWVEVEVSQVRMVY